MRTGETYKKTVEAQRYEIDKLRKENTGLR